MIDVKVVPPRTLHQRLLALDVPPRSRLYGLLPCGMETVWSESLTSYINRLGWRHGVSPRTLVVQEIGPLLADQQWWRYPSPQQMGTFCAVNAMGLNGSGHLATTWSHLLEHLTRRTDLHALTTAWWIGDLPQARNLRLSPAWCPSCYAEWKRQGLPIYQPLLWMLQVITVCLEHKRRLVERCPSCQGKQAVIASARAHLGECTKCALWLGEDPPASGVQKLDDELINWQEWVVHVLTELRARSLSSGVLQWNAFFADLAKGKKYYAQLARLTGFHKMSLYEWARGATTPSLELIFQFCYICGTTPLQMISDPLGSLEQVLQTDASMLPPPRSPSTRSPFDHEKRLSFLQSILDGTEEVLSISQTASHLKCTPHLLRLHFPLECQQITRQYREYQRQRQQAHLKSVCEAVRNATITLHAQGIPPTRRKVAALLADSGWMHIPDARRTWQATRQELDSLP